jgi:hypothetical protein
MKKEEGEEEIKEALKLSSLLLPGTARRDTNNQQRNP